MGRGGRLVGVGPASYLKIVNYLRKKIIKRYPQLEQVKDKKLEHVLRRVNPLKDATPEEKKKQQNISILQNLLKSTDVPMVGYLNELEPQPNKLAWIPEDIEMTKRVIDNLEQDKLDLVKKDISEYIVAQNTFDRLPELKIRIDEPNAFRIPVLLAVAAATGVFGGIFIFGTAYLGFHQLIPGFFPLQTMGVIIFPGFLAAGALYGMYRSLFSFTEIFVLETRELRRLAANFIHYTAKNENIKTVTNVSRDFSAAKLKIYYNRYQKNSVFSAYTDEYFARVDTHFKQLDEIIQDRGSHLEIDPLTLYHFYYQYLEIALIVQLDDLRAETGMDGLALFFYLLSFAFLYELAVRYGESVREKLFTLANANGFFTSCIRLCIQVVGHHTERIR